MALMMQKIDEYELRRYGSRSLQLGLPRVYTTDNDLEKNRNVAVFRANVYGVDAIIITPIEHAEKMQSLQNSKMEELVK